MEITKEMEVARTRAAGDRNVGTDDRAADRPGEPTGNPAAGRIAEVCEGMLADLDEISESALRRIRAEAPEYEILDVGEHRASVVAQFRGILTGLAAGRGPSSEESEAAFLLGRTRARQHLSVQSVIAAYHIGYRHVWETLRSRVGAIGASDDPELLQRVDTVWNWVQQAAGAAADGFGDFARLEDQTRSEAMQQLMGHLASASIPGEGAVEFARQLSLDPAGRFQLCVAHVTEFGLTELARLNRELGRIRGQGTAIAELRHGRLLALGQAMDAGAVLEVIQRHAPQAVIGVGIARDGLAGAQASLRDAQDALDYALRTPDAISSWAVERRVWRFEEAWLDVLTRDAPDRLQDVIAPAVAAALAHPDLAQTAWQHMENRLSFARTAEVMHLHPNSVRYRLERWRELTGWSFETVTERALTRVAIQAARSGSD